MTSSLGITRADSRSKMDGFEEDGAIKWDAYMRACSAFLNCGLPNFIEEELDLGSFPKFLLEAIRDGFKCWPLKPHSDVVDAIFTSNKMRALASFQDLYVGLEPYRDSTKFAGGVVGKTAPAVFGLLAALELHPTNEKAGVFAPIGGFQAISKAFEKFALDSGVEIMYQTTVTDVTQDGVWFLIENNNDKNPQFVKGNCIAVNANLPFATKSLMGTAATGNTTSNGDEDWKEGDIRYDWDDTMEYSSGVIKFHWSIDNQRNKIIYPTNYAINKITMNQMTRFHQLHALQYLVRVRSDGHIY